MPPYYAPAFRIEINGSRLAGDVSENIQDLTVVSKHDTLDSFSFTVVNAQPELRWTHTDDADLFKEGNSVSIFMGYVNDLQPMIEGEITQLKPVFPDQGIPTIGVEGNSRLHRLHGDNKTRTFQKMTDKQIAEQIAQEAGLQGEAEDTGIQYEYIIQPNQSDLQFLRERAARLHFEIVAVGKKLIFRRSQEVADKTFTLVWSQVQKGFVSSSTTFPLKSFSPQLDLLQPVSNVEIRAYDPSTKQALVSRADVSQQDSTMGGSKKAGDVCSAALQRPRTYVQVAAPYANQAEGDQQAKATLNQRAMNLVGGSAETIGIPALRSGKVVAIMGVGKRFEGLYYIDEATHSIGDSGYQTSLNLKRNSVS